MKSGRRLRPSEHNAGSPAKIAGKSAERARSRLKSKPRDEKRSEKKRDRNSEPEKQKTDKAKQSAVEQQADLKDDNEQDTTGMGGLTEIRKDADYAVTNADKRIRRAKRTAYVASGLLLALSVILLGLSVFYFVQSQSTRADVEKRFSSCRYHYERAVCARNLCGEELIVLTSKGCEQFFDLEERLSTCKTKRRCEGGQRKCLNGKGFVLPAGNGEIGYFKKGQRVQLAAEDRRAIHNVTTGV